MKTTNHADIIEETNSQPHKARIVNSQETGPKFCSEGNGSFSRRPHLGGYYQKTANPPTGQECLIFGFRLRRKLAVGEDGSPPFLPLALHPVLIQPRPLLSFTEPELVLPNLTFHPRTSARTGRRRMRWGEGSVHGRGPKWPQQ